MSTTHRAKTARSPGNSAPCPRESPSPTARRTSHLRSTRLCLWLSILATTSGPLNLSAELHWDAKESVLAADVDHQSLQQVLKDLSRATRWQIFVDPTLDKQVTTRFRRLKTMDGLARLLDPLNFALVPQAGAPPTLYVYGTDREDATLRFAQPLSPSISPPKADQTATASPPPELIVRLHPDADTTIEELAAAYGAKVVGQLSDLQSYRLQFSDEQSAQTARDGLASDPNVAATETNTLVPPPEAAKSISATLPPPPVLRPKVVPSDQQIVVALLDTPISSASTELDPLLLPALAVEGGASDVPDSLTHGTAMAETLYGSLATATLDPDGTPVRILPIDIYAGKEATTTFDVLEGLLLAAANGADVINLSLGGNEPSPLLQDAVQTLSARGILVIAAAGNQPTTTPVFPAAYPEVLAVTAVDPTGQIADYANRGEFIDLAGPGTSFIRYGNEAYLGTGTSYASAFIAGQAAAYLSAPDASPEAVDVLLRDEYGFRKTPSPHPSP